MVETNGREFSSHFPKLGVLLSRVAVGLSVLGWVGINHIFVARPKQSPFVCPYGSKSRCQSLFRLELIPKPGNQEEAV